MKLNVATLPADLLGVPLTLTAVGWDAVAVRANGTSFGTLPVAERDADLLTLKVGGRISLDAAGVVTVLAEEPPATRPAGASGCASRADLF